MLKVWAWRSPGMPLSLSNTILRALSSFVRGNPVWKRHQGVLNRANWQMPFELCTPWLWPLWNSILSSHCIPRRANALPWTAPVKCTPMKCTAMSSLPQRQKRVGLEIEQGSVGREVDVRVGELQSPSLHGWVQTPQQRAVLFLLRHSASSRIIYSTQPNLLCGITICH